MPGTIRRGQLRRADGKISQVLRYMRDYEMTDLCFVLGADIHEAQTAGFGDSLQANMYKRKISCVQEW
jgi:hypothetical protein